jgi:hypothetical protein
VTKAETPKLANAPLDVQLAVELILLLEQQDLSAATVLSALEIVRKDYQHKLSASTAE